MGKIGIEQFEGLLPAYEVLDTGTYIMTASRRQSFVFPEGAFVYDTDDNKLYLGDSTTEGGGEVGSGGGGGGDTTFSLSFKFAREGFNGTYSGGVAAVPYTSFTEDEATLMAGNGVISAVDSRITAVTAQFDSMAGDATIFYRVEGGGWTSLGVVTQAAKHVTFIPLAIAITAGSEIEFGFSSASLGSFTSPTITAYIREPLA